MNKVAAIWARVSTSDQTSLPDQVARAKEKLEHEGYLVPIDRILTTDWTSPELFNCPEFQRLRHWVKNREIQAIGLLDRDRLEAKGLQRLMFISDCREAEVELVICQGSPIIDGPEGQLVELALALGKERSVTRAKQGAKDGMHDKVVRDRKPTSRHRIFGYKWDSDMRLTPTDDWVTVKLVLDLVLDGITYRGISKELEKRGIPSPQGNSKWNVSTISMIVRNPIYSGRYYALCSHVCAPKHRRGNTYGNSSVCYLPLDQRIYLEEVQIDNPPITWEQFQQNQEHAKQNREFAKRNATHDYLLRGFIFCEKHYGENGKPRHYCGKQSGNMWIYTCPVGGCAHQRISGPDIEAEVKERAKFLISMPPHMFYEHFGDRKNKEELEQRLRRELENLEGKYKKNINTETELAGLRIRGEISEEAYTRQRSLIIAARTFIDERKMAINEELAKSNRQSDAIVALDQIKSTLSNGFANLSIEQWRGLLKSLNLEVHILDKEEPERTWHGQPIESNGWADIHFGIDIVPTKQVADIVFKRPCPLI